MSQAHHDPFAHSAGVTQSAVLPFILIILLVLSEIAFTLIALTGQESLRWMSEATQARSDHWSDAINRTAYILNAQRSGYAAHNATAHPDVTAALLERLRLSVDLADAADKKILQRSLNPIQEIAIKLFDVDGKVDVSASSSVRADVVALVRELLAAEPEMVPALALGANTSTLFDIHSRRALAPVVQAQDDISKLMAQSVYVVGIVIVATNVLALLGIWAIWRYLMRPGLVALEHAMRSKAHGESRLRAILRSIGDGVIATDQDKRVVEINDEAQRLTGYSDAEARDRRLEDVLRLVDGDLKTFIEQTNSTAALKERPTKKILRVRLQSDAGDERPLAMVVTTVRDDAGAPDGLALAFRDISDELAIRDMTIHREKAQVLERVAGSLAHDFNNLLAVILGNASLIAGAPNLDARQKTAVQAVLNSGRAGAELAKRLLSLSRPRTSQAELLALDSLVEGVVAMARLVLSGRRTIEIFSRSKAHVVVDRASLQIAILNILMNAIEATKDHGRIGVFCTCDVARNPGTVTIEIRDDGYGIPPQLLAEVAKPFFTTKSAIKGTGLGLSSTEAFLESAGGRLDIQSEVNRGTSVFLTLPMADHDKVEAAPAIAAQADNDGQQMNILVLDDRRDVAETLRSLIVMAGHQASAATSATAPELEPDRVAVFDIVVCDVQLGDTTGSDVEARLVRSLGAQRPPFLFITGNAPAQELETMTQGDDRRILLKPFDIADLLRAAQARLKHWRESPSIP